MVVPMPVQDASPFSWSLALAQRSMLASHGAKAMSSRHKLRSAGFLSRGFAVYIGSERGAYEYE